MRYAWYYGIMFSAAIIGLFGIGIGAAVAVAVAGAASIRRRRFAGIAAAIDARIGGDYHAETAWIITAGAAPRLIATGAPGSVAVAGAILKEYIGLKKCVFVHTHPDYNLAPSYEDVGATRAMRALGLRVTHLIVHRGMWRVCK